MSEDQDAPVLPVLIGSERVRLIPMSSTDVVDMIGGRHQDRWHPDYPRPDDVVAASMAHVGDTWSSRHIVLGHLAVGSIGCFGPPADGETEVGYGLVEDARGAGVATEALQLLAAEADRVGIRLRASVEPDNRASVRVLAKCGFTELRGSDEEGNLVMARPLPSA